MDYVLTDIHFHTNLSFDAYENSNKGNFDIEEFVNNEKQSNNKLGLLVKTDHNILDYKNYNHLKDVINEHKLNLVILPGIELNSSDGVHWIFVFDDLKLCEKSNNSTIGELLDLRIKELFNYSELVPPMKELMQAQIDKVNIDEFVSILNDLEISFLAIPHLNKDKGFYKKLKKNKDLFIDVENYLNDNIIMFLMIIDNNFTNKNHAFLSL